MSERAITIGLFVSGPLHTFSLIHLGRWNCWWQSHLLWIWNNFFLIYTWSVCFPSSVLSYCSDTSTPHWWWYPQGSLVLEWFPSTFSLAHSKNRTLLSRCSIPVFVGFDWYETSSLTLFNWDLIQLGRQDPLRFTLINLWRRWPKVSIENWVQGCLFIQLPVRNQQVLPL